MSPFAQIGLGLFLTTVTVGIHAVFVLLAIGKLRRMFDQRLAVKVFWVETLVVLAAIIGLTLITLLECVIWAIGFMMIGALPDFWEALYFVLVALTTLGFGDIILGEEYRLLSGLCALAGLVVIGITTAFLIELLRVFAAANHTGRFS